ncbi:MAG: CvpA family protein [Candidatus Omnitrophota bacterium]|nr:MAG: CvpA family protein [Candidatus Omnitrophota bacterium]
MEVIKRVALIDFVFLIVCLRILYIAIIQGVLREAFRLGGIFCGSVLAFHFYPQLAKTIEVNLPLVGQKYFALAAFILIFLGAKTAFYLVAKIAGLLFERENNSLVQRWISFFMGILRFIVLGSTALYLFSISPLNPKYYEGLALRALKNAAPKIYLVSAEIFKKSVPELKVEANKEVQNYYEAEKFLSGSSEEGA